MGALLNGAKLVLYPSDPLLDVLKLRDLIQKAGVSILWLTAGLFHRIADGDLPLFTPIKQLLVGGDVISATHARKVVERISGCRVINGYGPTEGTTFSVCFPVPDSSSIERMVRSVARYRIALSTSLILIVSRCQSGRNG